MNTHFRERRSFATISRLQAMAGVLGGDAALIGKTATAEGSRPYSEASAVTRVTAVVHSVPERVGI